METIRLAPNKVRIPTKPNFVKFESGARGALYPITVLRSLKSEYIEDFSRNKIMLVKDLARYDFKRLKALTGLGDETLRSIKDEVERLCRGNFSSKRGRNLSSHRMLDRACVR